MAKHWDGFLSDCTFDIWSGYNNILVKPEDRYWVAFKTTEGQYEPVVMPFGLMNTPATFQHMINHYACPVQVKYGTKHFKVYLDDVLITTRKDDPAELHDQIVQEWLAICYKYQLFLQTEKCKFKQAQSWLSGTDHWWGQDLPRPYKTKGSDWMAQRTNQQRRGLIYNWCIWISKDLCRRIVENSSTTDKITQKGTPLWMDQQMHPSNSSAEAETHQWTSIVATNNG